MHIDTINMGLPIVYIEGVSGRIFKIMMCVCLYALKVVLTLENSADPDEMQHYAAFHLGLHCLGVSSTQRVNKYL